MPSICTEVKNIVGDHLLVYNVEDDMTPNENIKIKSTLSTEFEDRVVNNMTHFITPVEKIHDNQMYKIQNDSNHYTRYEMQPTELKFREVDATNQFGAYKLILGQARVLITPSEKHLESQKYKPPKDADHFKLYEIIQFSYDTTNYVSLKDQFGKFKAIVTHPAY